MALAESGTAPALVKSTGNTGTTTTTASFSPPADSVVVVMASWGWGTGADTATIADSSGGGNWTNTLVVENTGGSGGVAVMGMKRFVSAPGAITVTVTWGGSLPSGGGRYLAVKVVTGASTSPQGASSGGIVNNSTAFTRSITPQTTGSWVYGICTNDAASSGGFTAAANTTEQNNAGTTFYTSSDNVCMANFRSTNTLTTSPITLGETWASNAWGTVLLMEVKAAGTTQNINVGQASTPQTAQPITAKLNPKRVAVGQAVSTNVAQHVTRVTKITLRTVWLNDTAEPSDRQGFTNMATLKVSTNRSIEVRQVGKGYLVPVRRAGVTRQFVIELPGCDRDQIAWLEAHAGRLLCVRDDRGRKTFGVYQTVQLREHRTTTQFAHASVTLAEVTHTE